MPNTPAAVQQGFSCCFAGPGVAEWQRSTADRLLSAVAEIAWVHDEALIYAANALSGGGPAYVFLLVEMLEQAALAEGLPADIARRMARDVVTGGRSPGRQQGSRRASAQKCRQPWWAT